MRFLSLATVFAALSGFAIIILAPRILSEALTVQFMALWGLFFACTGIIDGLTQETTRAISAAEESGRVGNARPIRFAVAVGLVMALAIIASSPLWMPHLVDTHHATATVLLACGLGLYACQALLSGVLSGLKLWSEYAGLLALDSGIRILLLIPAWLLGWGLPAFILITVIGALSWCFILAASPRARQALNKPTDVSARTFRSNALQAMLATGATAVLITGFPTIMKALLSDAPTNGVTMGGLVMAVTLTRAPILVPLQRFQSALIVFFVEHRGQILSALAKPICGVFAVGGVGAVAAWLLGPTIMRLVFPPEFVVPGPHLAVLTFASACAGALMITSTAAVAAELHRLYILGWVVASIVAIGVVLLPLGLVPAVCIALFLGPTAGILVQVLGLLSARTGEDA
ncbi:polysaccharide biosynthesis protein [Corynebacterium epidermidicanis]|uniref:Putative membrane protein n=1 Tax=Corynebacterium epidermidicanis TaxID=1050174 RepID=A0A0G3GZ03_9CORY|nr:membrane protein [Corynebacterium epidermidicanis]AKK04082.1 putative membrane protein [Corynebacterium epidermidicanis]